MTDIQNLDKPHRQHDQERQTILDALTSVDYSSLQNNLIASRQEGVGEWLLKHWQFKGWQSKKKSTLLCSGFPGTGKTMIASIVVDHLKKKFEKDPNIGIAFLYCNFWQQPEQQLTDLLLSLLQQFSQRQPLLPPDVRNLYGSFLKEEVPDLPSSEITDALGSVIGNYSRAFIVVDALDECSVTDGVLSRFMEELFILQAKTGISLFATSRLILGIPQEFKRRGSSVIEIHPSDQAMGIYLDGHLDQLSPFVKEDPDIEREIKSAIIKAAGGM